MEVDTELIRVNFVREESELGGRAQAGKDEGWREEQNGGSFAVQRLRPVVILAPAPRVTFVASADASYSSLCFSLGPPLCAHFHVGWSRKRISTP